jgi:N4-(beta-N-acetylglucosaminyl)-L-asparaginase
MSANATPATPVMLSTWSFGTVANSAGWPLLASGGSALDAVVAGATAVEDDPSVDSVGVGGIPDASGRPSLDASVMTNPDRCGSVCFVREYAQTAQIARRVMERTVHVLLAGAGAEAFAASEGFARRELLTPPARAAYAQWLEGKSASDLAGYRGTRPPMNVEERYREASVDRFGKPLPGHDTVCCLARDAKGELAGVCTTSGLGFKMPGRVGDSPIIGHGLYVDQTAGAASATGNGELIMGVCGSFLAVELMRQGREPLEAIVAVLERVRDRYQLVKDHQVAMIAVRADGRAAWASLRPGFVGVITTPSGTQSEAPQRVLLPA